MTSLAGPVLIQIPQASRTMTRFCGFNVGSALISSFTLSDAYIGLTNLEVLAGEPPVSPVQEPASTGQWLPRCCSPSARVCAPDAARAPPALDGISVGRPP